MFLVTISCARSEDNPCPQLLVSAARPEDLAEAVTKRLADAGWILRDGQHYCPRHDPADVGELLEVGGRYVPIRDTGWEIRVPATYSFDPGQRWQLEIRRIPSGQANDD